MSTPTWEPPAGTQLATVLVVVTVCDLSLIVLILPPAAKGPSLTTCPTRSAMLPSLFLSSTLLFSLATVQVRAGRMHWLQPCNLAHQKLQQGTFQFQTDCDDTTYCAANSTCARRGCRSDDYPFGYPPNTTVPPTR